MNTPEIKIQPKKIRARPCTLYSGDMSYIIQIRNLTALKGIYHGSGDRWSVRSVDRLSVRSGDRYQKPYRKVKISFSRHRKRWWRLRHIFATVFRSTSDVREGNSQKRWVNSTHCYTKTQVQYHRQITFNPAFCWPQFNWSRRAASWRQHSC